MASVCEKVKADRASRDAVRIAWQRRVRAKHPTAHFYDDASAGLVVAYHPQTGDRLDALEVS